MSMFPLPEKFKTKEKTIVFGAFEKIKHNSVKERKDFILDMIYIAVAKAILEIAVNQNFENDPDIITIHRNKNRKEYKKIKEYLDYITKLTESIYYRLESQDCLVAEQKARKLAVPFIRTLAQYNNVSLELLSISIFDVGLNRKRKTKLHEVFKPFADYKFLYAKLGTEVEKAGVREAALENEMATQLSLQMKY
jgi:hypothetical protein